MVIVYFVTDFASSCLGSAVIHVRSSDWRIVRCVGQAVLPVGHRLLHLRSDPSDEAQPLVGLTVLIIALIIQSDTKSSS